MSNKNVRLLSQFEYAQWYLLPTFSAEQQALYFDLSAEEMHLVKLRTTLHSKIDFILRLGYFKCQQRCFSFTAAQVKQDAAYIKTRYFTQEKGRYRVPSHDTTGVNNKAVLALMGYNGNTQQCIAYAEQEIAWLVTQVNSPAHIMRGLADSCRHNKYVLPAYTRLQTMIGRAVAAEDRRLAGLIKHYMTPDIAQHIDTLLSDKEEHRYKIQLLKINPQRFAYKQLQQHIQLFKTHQPLFEFAKKVVPHFNLSVQNRQYYTDLIDYYNRYELNELKRDKMYLYILCYMLNRPRYIVDQLIESILHYVKKYTEAASLYAKEVSTKDALAIAQHLPEGSQLLRFYNDENLYPQSFDTIRQQAHAILPAEKLDTLCDYLARKPNSQQDHQWIYYTEQHKTISKNLRPFCMAVDFTYGSSSKTLETAVNFLKNVFAKKQSLSKQAINTFPTAFIPAAIKSYIVTDEGIDVYRYECCVYLQLAARLNNGLVTCDDSTQYRDFNTEIKEAVNWKDEAVRAEIIAQLDVDELSLSGDELVKLYEQDINTLYDTVNADILSGKNKAIKLTLQDDEVHDWRLPYKALNDEYNHTFYNQVPRVSLSTVLEFVDAHTDMLAECVPLKSYGFKTPLHKGALNACITANATDLGTFKMSEICNLNYNLLYRTNRSRVRCDTLQAANDNIIYHFTQLGIYPHYTIADDIAWMSVDGQKFKTERDTFKARHSPKYYGLGKGVVAYSGIMNNIALVTRMIGANEHESHHLNALTQDISREITINRLASDTEGSNKVNYVLLRGHKIDYTPCYKTLKKRAAALVSFRSVDYYHRNQYVIKPHEKIKTALIARNWDKVKRFRQN